MLYTALCTIICTAASLATAAAITPRNIHVSDFRGFGATNCHDENLGVWTVIDEDLVADQPCKDFGDNTVFSLQLSNMLENCHSMYLALSIN